MDRESKIAELGMLNMLYEMKNPLTNIRLSLELLEAGTANDPQEYYAIIKKSALNIETSIRELCKSFNDLGITIHIGSEDQTQI